VVLIERLCAPNFLERCLNEAPRAPMTRFWSRPRTRFVSGHPEQSPGLRIRRRDPRRRTVGAPRAAAFTLDLNNALSGLIRMSALRRTRLVEAYRGADVVLMAPRIARQVPTSRRAPVLQTNGSGDRHRPARSGGRAEVSLSELRCGILYSGQQSASWRGARGIGRPPCRSLSGCALSRMSQ